MRGRAEGRARLLRALVVIVMLAGLAAAGAQAASRHDRETDSTATDMLACRTGGLPYGKGPTDPGPDPAYCSSIPPSKKDARGAVVFCQASDQPIVVDSETQGYGTLYTHGVEAGTVVVTVVGPKPSTTLAYSGTHAITRTDDPTMGHVGRVTLPRLAPGTYSIGMRYAGGTQMWHHPTPSVPNSDHVFEITWLGSAVTGSFTVADCASDTVAVTSERIGNGLTWKATATDGACTTGLSYGWRVTDRTGLSLSSQACPNAGTLPHAGKYHIVLNRFAWRGFPGGIVEKDVAVGGIAFTSAPAAKGGRAAGAGPAVRSFDVKVRLDDEKTSAAGCDEKASYTLKALAGTTAAKRTGPCAFRVAITPPDPPKRARTGYVYPWISAEGPAHDPLELLLAKRLEQWRSADRAIAAEAQCGDALDHGKLAEARDKQLKDAYLSMSLAHDALTQIQAAGIGELSLRVTAIAAAIAAGVVALPAVQAAILGTGAVAVETTAAIGAVNVLGGIMTSLGGLIGTFMVYGDSGSMDKADLFGSIASGLQAFTSAFVQAKAKVDLLGKVGAVTSAFAALKGVYDASGALGEVLTGMDVAAKAFITAGFLYNNALNALRNEITLLNTAFSLCRLEVTARNGFGDVFTVTGSTAKGSAPGAGSVAYARG